MLNTITLLGSSSGRNAGDAALLEGIMSSIDDACRAKLTYEIPTPKPAFITKQYTQNVVPIGMMPWDLSIKILGLPTYRSIMRTDLSLVFDAVLFDRSLYNPLFNFLSTLYLFLGQAKRKNKRMGFFNVTIGPVNTSSGRDMLRDLSEMMDFITVRDAGSLTLLRDIGVKNPNAVVTADAALIVSPAPEEASRDILRSLGIDPSEEILAVNINRYIDSWAGTGKASMGKEAFVDAYTEALKNVTAKIKAPILFVATQHHDVAITTALMNNVSRFANVAFLSNVDYSHNQIKGVLKLVSLLSGMRLHCTILGSGACTPTLGLEFLPKVRHYFDSLGLSEYCLSFKDFSVSSLTDHILRGWTERDKIRAQLSLRIPQLQIDARKAGQIVAAMRAGTAMDTALQMVGT